ncbi:MAG: PadR family transcriptional regulator, partial [Thermoplasmata archaeon]|nr:PadR family transcriptional regulator [Thermoplasmata archaeon]
MKKGSEAPTAFRRRLVGLYALTLMEREGPLHGYGLSERIARRTEGAWRPGPGSVYPSLRKLSEFGLARAQSQHRRRVYAITPRGRALLRRIRQRDAPMGRPRPEVFGSADVGRFLVQRLRRTVESIEAQIARAAPGQPSPRELRNSALAELKSASTRLRKLPIGAPRGRAGAERGP